tara:strand:+ start:1243 stop:1851 length:609 start_codon:yes stop_codon:yes gene_type:complete
MIDYIQIILNYIQILVFDNYLLALISYFIFCLLFFFLSLPGGIIVTLSSGFFFGFYIGFLINIISITIGSLFFIILSKYFLVNYFNNYLLKYTDKLNKIIKKSSYEYLILIRLIFGIPLFVQNLFISTLEISKFKFIVSSLIGFSPYFLIFSFVGDKISNLLEIKSFSIKNIFSIEIIVILIILVLILIFRIFYKINSNKIN